MAQNCCVINIYRSRSGLLETSAKNVSTINTQREASCAVESVASVRYDESTTTDTLFHKLKFGIDKTFENLYEISTSKKGANSICLAERFGVNQKTAWLFRQKAQAAMQSSEQYPLEAEVHIDESK